MRKLCLKGAVLALLSSGPLTAYADTFETQRCINVGNALDAPNEGDWGHVIEADSFRVIAKAGFDTVRIPVRWSAHTSRGPDYKINERFFRRVTQVINQALAHDLQIILNIHHFEQLNENPQRHRAKFLALWDQIATRYKDLPDSVYFEVINEPNANFSGDVMRSMVTDAFHKIRETNPTRILIMGGDNWSGIHSLPTIPSIDDPNQVYTFHYYDPFPFTHQKASWTDLKNSGRVNWGSRADKDELRRAATLAKQTQDRLGIPIFLGEIGAYEKAPYDDIVDYTLETRQAFEQAGISWCVWNFTATFPFYDTQIKRWDERKLAALGLSPDGSRVNITPQPQNSLSRTPTPLEAAIEGLKRELGSDGTLMMPPEPDRLGYYGPLNVRTVTDTAVPGGQAIEVTVPRQGANPWDGGVSGALPSRINQGDRLVMVYWAKVVRGKGEISNAGLQMNKDPYPPIDALRPAQLTRDWTPYAVMIKADKNYAPMEAGYSFQLTNAAQTVRIGPVVVLNLSSP